MQIIREVKHHGATAGVTGSCHELVLHNGAGILVDCGLFQGAEVSGKGAAANDQSIDFPLDHIQALVITHCHIDHVGRLPWLFMQGFAKPIYCTEATAHLLPLVIEDALKVGITRNPALIEAVLQRLQAQLHPLPYDKWHTELGQLRLRLRPAGHILGSAYVEFEPVFTSLPAEGSKTTERSRPDQAARAADHQHPALNRVVFSGDLGCRNSPLLPDPTPLEYARLLVLESTYGDRNHEHRQARDEHLQQVIEHCVADNGAVLIPAFSIGRTQELLYELEDIIHRCHQRIAAGEVAHCIWQDMVVVVDSPMAARFTEQYRKMKQLWDDEAKARLADDRHPLNFSRLHIVNTHDEHVRIVNYLKSTADPCIIISASGMCTGGRMVNYLKALLPDPRTDVLFVGYQAEGTPGRDIQRYGPRGGWVELAGERIAIKAQVHTLGGYSAHADQDELIDFVRQAHHVCEVRLVHGDEEAKQALARRLREELGVTVTIGRS